jgi:hypothetical protein
MEVNCAQVWIVLSSCLEDDIKPALPYAIEEHIRSCRRCVSVLQGMRNVIHLYEDSRILELPLGFSQRLRSRLEEAADHK